MNFISQEKYDLERLQFFWYIAHCKALQIEPYMITNEKWLKHAEYVREHLAKIGALLSIRKQHEKEYDKYCKVHGLGKKHLCV